MPGQRVGEQALLASRRRPARSLKRLSAPADSASIASRGRHSSRHSTRTSVPPPPPRSSGVLARGHTERSQPASGVAAAPRPRAAGAPAARACAPAARPRAARAGACTHSNAMSRFGWWWWWWWLVGDNSAKFSRQASQNLGKYISEKLNDTPYQYFLLRL